MSWNVKRSHGEFAYLPSSLAVFLAPVLQKEFVGAKSDKLLAGIDAACGPWRYSRQAAANPPIVQNFDKLPHGKQPSPPITVFTQVPAGAGEVLTTSLTCGISLGWRTAEKNIPVPRVGKAYGVGSVPRYCGGSGF